MATTGGQMIATWRRDLET